MRRLFSFLLICSLSINCWAQTQQGVVKTKGRMVNGKHVAGQGLSGATITIQGRSAVLSQTNGAFSFPVTNKVFTLQGVKKNGYQLVDADATRKTYQYSPNTFYLIMETPDQQAEDKLTAERKIRRTLQRQLQQREDELEELKEQNRLTQEEYRRKLQQLYDDQQNNERLISEMAKRYSELDYDQMDELKQQINVHILNGELVIADSLIKTKGDIKARALELKQHIQSNAAVRSNLEKSEAIAQRKLLDLADDCFSRYEIFLTQHYLDSAAYYIKFRASLDTTNVTWANEAGKFLFDYMDDGEGARRLFASALYHTQHLSQPHGNMELICYNNLASTYRRNNYNDYLLCKDYFQKALDLAKQLYGEDHIYTAVLYNNFGMFSYSFRTGEDYNLLSKALSICELEKNSSDGTIITIYNNFGSLLYEKKYYENAFLYYEKAMKACDRIYHDNQPIVAVVYNNIGNTLGHLNKYSEAAYYLEKSIAVREHLLGTNHSLTISSYNNMGMIFYKQKKYEQATKYYQNALLSLRELRTPISYVGATVNNNMGVMFYDNHQYSKAIPYFAKAIELSNDERFKEQFSIYHSNMASTYYAINNYDKSIEHFSAALKGNSNNYMKLRANISCIYNLKQDYARALEFQPNHYGILASIYTSGLYEQTGDYKEAFEILSDLINSFADYADSGSPGAGIILLYHNTMDDNELDCNYLSSLDYYVNLLNSRKQTLGDNNINTAIAYSNLGTYYSFIGKDKEKAKLYYQKAISTKKRLLGEKHPSIAISYILFGLLLENEDETSAVNYYKDAKDIVKASLKDNAIIKYLDLKINGPSQSPEGWYNDW